MSERCRSKSSWSGPGETALRRGRTAYIDPAPASTTGDGERVYQSVARGSRPGKGERGGGRWCGRATASSIAGLAYGSVGPTVMRARKAEELLIGKPFSAELALEAGQVASEEISPIDDVRSTAWYRREVVKALTHDALQMAWERAEETRGQGDKETGRQGELPITSHVSRFTPHVHASRNTRSN